MVISTFLQTFLVSLFPFIILAIYIHNKWNSFHYKNTKNLPPSPQKLPIIGNFHQLGSNPNQSLHIMSQKHGPIMLLHLGSIPTIVASSAEAAKEILKTHDLSFCTRPKLRITSMLSYGSLDIAFAPYGEYWRQLKSIMVLNLLSNSRVMSYQKVREDEVSNLISKLIQSCGTVVNMRDLFTSFTSNIVFKVAIGRTFDGSKQANLVRKVVETATTLSVGDYFPWLKWVDQVTGLERRAQKVAKEFDEFLESIIEENVNNKKKGVTSDEGRDFVDILLDVQKDNATGFVLTRDSIKAVILDAFTGGIDTTATTLEWAISDLISNPRVMRKLQEEVSGVVQGRSVVSQEDLKKMQYLKSVVKETLRLHPPVAVIALRKAMKDVKLMGYDVSVGTQVMINAWAIGRDPAMWEEPIKFMPERFFNNPINYYQGIQFEWLPFGGGRRSCPGIQFSVPILELALANIICNFDIVLPNGMKNEDLDMREEYGMVVLKKSPLLVRMNQKV